MAQLSLFALIREARAAANLDHPNICAIHEVGNQDSLSFIVMQYVEGETLADLINRKALAVTEALDIACQIADALARFGQLIRWESSTATSNRRM